MFQNSNKASLATDIQSAHIRDINNRLYKLKIS